MESALPFPRSPVTDSPRPADTAALVDAARAGDRRALGALHERYAPMVHAVLLGRVAPDHADDLVQEVFITAMRRLHQLQDGARFGPWVSRIARNKASDHHRARRVVVPLPDTLGVAPRPRAEAAQALAILRTLPEAYRETLLMRLVEGMTGPEIAAATGLSPGSVRVNLHRGMKLLRARLDEGGTP
ncbi:MAG: sigma-70 family RNA polymerase sigma factor [Alphaproteobacteria bacterium]|nr:sigma-70 family RNA polymerase sigma factor [Alphaproteobacteria bacterium]